MAAPQFEQFLPEHSPSRSAKASQQTYLDIGRAVVVAQLVERLLLTPEICSSNPDCSKSYLDSTILSRQK